MLIPGEELLKIMRSKFYAAGLTTRQRRRDALVVLSIFAVALCLLAGVYHPALGCAGEGAVAASEGSTR